MKIEDLYNFWFFYIIVVIVFINNIEFWNSEEKFKVYLSEFFDF